MKLIILSLAVLFAAVASGQDAPPKPISIPESMQAEAKEIMTLIQGLGLQQTPAGHPDLCAIPEGADRDRVFKFIEDVNTNGGFLPTPKCE